MMKYFRNLSLHYRETIKLGVPIVLGQIAIVAVGLADNIMVGRFATEDLAASSFVNSVFNIPILFGLGFSYGLTPLVGQFFGRGEYARIGGLLRNSLLANLIVGVLLTVVMCILYLNVDLLGQPEELLPLIRPYYLLQLASLVFVMLFNSFKQFADGITDTQTPMWIMLGGNLFNIIGNYILIYGYLGFPAMGLTGAGIATLISRVLMLVAFVFYFFRSRAYQLYVEGYRRSRYNGTDLLRLNKMGVMVGLQMGMETALFSITGVMVGWLGTLSLAAHQVVISLSTLGFMVYYGVGAAISVRVSNYYGRGDLKNVRQATISGLHLILALALVVSLFFLITRRYIGYVFTTSDEVVAIVATLMYIMIFYQFGDSLQITYANALRGVTDVTSMAVISFVGYFLIALPVAYLAGFVLDWGLVGVWISYPVGLFGTGIMMCVRYYYFLRRKNRPLISEYSTVNE